MKAACSFARGPGQSHLVGAAHERGAVLQVEQQAPGARVARASVTRQQRYRSRALPGSLHPCVPPKPRA